MDIVSGLCTWAFIGYFVVGFKLLPPPKDRNDALWQTFILGPVFWVCIGLAGIKVLIYKIRSNSEK